MSAGERTLPASIEDCTPAQQWALTVYMLHAECGYTFTGDGCLWALTNQEIEMLWQGRSLYQHFFQRGQTAQGKPGQVATSGDHRAFEQFAAEMNGQ